MDKRTSWWHDDEHFPYYWIFVSGIHWSLADSSHKGPAIGILCSLCCYPKQAVEKYTGDLTKWDIVILMWHHCNVLCKLDKYHDCWWSGALHQLKDLNNPSKKNLTSLKTFALFQKQSAFTQLNTWVLRLSTQPVSTDMKNLNYIFITWSRTL